MIIGFGLTAQAQERPDTAKQAQWEQFKAKEGENWNIRWKGKTGVPRVISNGLTKTYSGSAESIARQFLSEYRHLFSLKNELVDLKHAKTQTNRGVRHVAFKQYYKGLPVEGGEYKVHIREDGRVDMANGHYFPDIQISIEPAISQVQAISAAKSDLSLNNPKGEESMAELVVYPLSDSVLVLSYKTRVITNNPTSDWIYFIDAANEVVLDKYNQITSVTGTGKVYPKHPNNSTLSIKNLYGLIGNGRLDGTYVKVYNDATSEAYSASHSFQYSTSSTHFDEVSLYYHVDNFRRNFIEALDSENKLFDKLNATARDNDTCPNNACFWSVTGDIYFSDGDPFAREDKVVHHEYGHAVIYDIESGISSSVGGEEGAISEGVPDYFAGSFTNRAKILEYALPSFKRDMSNPEITAYSQYQSDSPGPHTGGEFFSSILWDIRNSSAISTGQTNILVFDALYRISGNPDFLEFRDAMMAADMVINSGKFNKLIQVYFANKGVGSPPPLPSAPANAIVTNIGLWGNPIIEWDESVDLDIDYYEVWRQQKRMADNHVFSPLHIASPTGSTFTDTFIVMDNFPNAYNWRYAISAVNTSGQHSALSTYTQWVNGNSPLKEIASSESENVPEFFALQQNYPNPFNPSTQITYALPEKARVTLRIYNIMGQEVAALVNSDMAAGFHEVTFDAGSFSSGVYIAKLTAEGNSGKVFSKELKMQLIK